MENRLLFTNMNFKRTFSNRYLLSFLILIIIIVLWQNINLMSKLTSCNENNDNIHKMNFVDSSVSSVLKNTEGLKVSNLVLQNISGEKYFYDFFAANEYCIIFYINGVVCDPCVDFIGEYWKNHSQYFPKKLSKQLILMENKNDRSTFINLKKNQMEYSYFVDLGHQFRKELTLNDFPTNFVFLFDKNFRIIYSDYFISDRKDKLYSFISKTIRFVNNEE